jgi:hypothetical protein
MSNFPLYDNLVKDLPSEEMSTKQKDKFMKLIKDIDEKGSELIYALIRVYQLENSEDKSTFKLPYGGKFIKHDMKFDLNDFPNELKHMLLKFITMHSNTMKEETEISENRDIELS